MALAAPIIRHHYERDFDDLGIPSVVADLKHRAGFVLPRSDATLDILSASTYADHKTARWNTDQHSSPTISWGYTIRHDMEGGKKSQASKKPRSATSKSDSSTRTRAETSSKKQRGRPRLETRDETAADRRRTQIRLAQRAYRNRKETTISALKGRVTELQRTIEQMHQSFSLLHDNLVDSIRLLPAATNVADQLETTMEEFEQLSKVAAADDLNEDEETQILTTSRRDNETSSTSSKTSDDERDSDIQFTLPVAEDEQMEDDALQMTLTDPFESSGGVTPAQIAHLETSLINAAGASNWSTGSIERPFENTATYTYSFQETTFARRLQRQCLERSFRYLSNPTLDPTFASTTFRFIFTLSNRKRIVNRLQEILRRKAGESLENFTVPFFPIGGAGTHFPRRDDNGDPVYPPNMLSPATAFGPRLQVTDVETPRPEETTEKVLEAIGFGGEWFDSHDVEEFLKTKGIYLDAQSSFVGVDSSLVGGGSQSNLNQFMTPPQQLTVDGSSLSITQSFGETFGQSNIYGQPESSMSSGWMWNMAEPGAFISPAPFGSGYASSSRTLTFDVEKFLSRLAEKSACLGRAPGFRRNDVENALQAALQDTL